MSDETPTTIHNVVDYRIKALEKRADAASGFHEAILKRLAAGDTMFVQLQEGTERVEDLVAEIKGAIQWAVKIVLGAVIMAILALVIKSAASPTPHSSPPSASVTESTSGH